MLPKKYLEIALSLLFILLAVLLYGSADTVNQAVSKASTDSTSTYVNTLAVVLGVVASIELVMSIFSNPATIEFAKNPFKFIALIILLVVYIWGMEHIGFVFATLLFLPATMRMMGYKSWIKSLMISTGITLFVYLLFQVGFEILLPEPTLFEGFLS